MSGGVLQNRCSYKFCRLHKKTPELKRLVFNEVGDRWSSNFIQKEIPAQMFFFVNFAKFLMKPFLKKPFGRLLHKHWFCLLSQHNLVPFQKRCHAYFPAEYFLDLICRLQTRVSSILQNLSQKPIFNPVEYLWWSFFAKIVNSLKLLSIFAKKIRPGSKYTSASSL